MFYYMLCIVRVGIVPIKLFLLILFLFLLYNNAWVHICARAAYMLPRLLVPCFLIWCLDYLHLFFSSSFPATMSSIRPRYSCFSPSSSVASPMYSLYACSASPILCSMSLFSYAPSCSFRHLFSSSRRWMIRCWVWIFLSLFVKYIFIPPVAVLLAVPIPGFGFFFPAE